MSEEKKNYRVVVVADIESCLTEEELKNRIEICLSERHIEEEEDKILPNIFLLDPAGVVVHTYLEDKILPNIFLLDGGVYSGGSDKTFLEVTEYIETEVFEDD